MPDAEVTPRRCRGSLARGHELRGRGVLEPLISELGTPTRIGANGQSSRRGRRSSSTSPTDAWFDVRLMHKDIALARALAQEHDIRLATAAADEALTRAENLGYGGRDIAALYETLARTPAR